MQVDGSIFSSDNQNTSGIISSQNPNEEEKHKYEEISFQIHVKMKFTSDRKRMSVLVTDEEDDQYKLYMKGADSEILKRLSSDQDPNEILKVKNFMQ